MKFNISFKAINLLAALFSFFLVVVALYIQDRFQLEPCPLCITQRIIFIVAGGAFFFFSFFNPLKIVKIFHLIALLLINLTGVVFSVRHILIQSKIISVQPSVAQIQIICSIVFLYQKPLNCFSGGLVTALLLTGLYLVYPCHNQLY